MPEIRAKPGRVAIAVVLGSAAFCVSIAHPQASPQRNQRKAEYATYQEVQPILQALQDAAPPELQSALSAAGDERAKAGAWAAWARQRDAQIRARLMQGDEDTLVNLLLFGTSFTKHPRISPVELLALSASRDAAALAEKGATLRARMDDLAAQLAAPASNARLQFARSLLERRGMHPALPQDRERIQQYFLDNLKRVLREQAGYSQTLEAARQLGSSSEEFVERSKLYKERGLSLDTSLKPDFALEESLKEMKRRGLLQPLRVQRVAIVGPGLDFTDKDAGYDFYPPQTVQPFAVLDSLLRLGLASADKVEVVTLDLSPRVNEHIAALRARARAGAAYLVNLPRDTAHPWMPDLMAFYRQFGDRIGAPVAAARPPQGSGVEMRAVRIRANVAQRIEPLDANIVLQRLPVQPGEEFDLVIATNILVYYDTFEQTLALSNIEKMLRPGGFLLTNNVLLELPAVKMKSLDYRTVVYSDRPDDGDQLVWYRREK